MCAALQSTTCCKHSHLIRCLRQRQRCLQLLAAFCTTLLLIRWLLPNDSQLTQSSVSPIRSLIRSLPPPQSSQRLPQSPGLSELATNAHNFSYFHRLAWQQMDASLHWMDIGGSGLPLMRLSAAEESADYRASRAAQWLRSQSLAVVGTVRNAMPGLRQTLKNLQQLCSRFASCSIVLLENDSNDGSRKFLHRLSRSDSRITILGCGRVNSAQPCRLSVAYSSGKRHRPGSSMQRNTQEEIERGLVMSALRNQLLAHVYTRLASNHSLLAVIDPDLNWDDWDHKSLLQGLYYFATRPSLDSLCSASYYYYWGRRTAYDPCTLEFHGGDALGGRGAEQPETEAERSSAALHRAAWPVKVKSCFQGFTFYRMSSLSAARLMYRKGHGEWICEHNTLSRQLAENYLDPNMQLRVRV